MKKKLGLLAASILCFFASSAYAASVGIQIIQKDGNIKDVRQISYVIEESFLDIFFDAGLIATNAPVAISSSDEKDASIIKKSLKEALEGNVDYLIVVDVLFKQSDSVVIANVLLNDINSISWELYNVHTGLSVKTMEYDVSKVVSKYKNEDGVKRYTKNVAQDVLSALKKVI